MSEFVGGGKVQLFISHPHIQNKSTKRSEHEMDMIRKSAAANAKAEALLFSQDSSENFLSSASFTC